MTTDKPCSATSILSFDDHLCFCSGDWIRYRNLKLPVDDLGFRQGITAVERLRTYRSQPFQVSRHLQRWQHTTEMLQISGLPTTGQIQELIAGLLRHNQSLVSQQVDVGITLFGTPGSTASQPTFAAHLNRLDHDGIEHKRQHGQPLVLTKIQQPSEQSWPRSIKVRSRIHYYLADIEARRQHPDAIGVLVDSVGNITETSTSNLAIVTSQQIISPPTATVLRGITQMVVEELAKGLGIPWRKEPVSCTDFCCADEILLMGTDGGIWFASSVDGESIGSRDKPAIFQKIDAEFSKQTGR